MGDLGAIDAQAPHDLASPEAHDLAHADLAGPPALDLGAPPDLVAATPAPTGPVACDTSDFTSGCAPATVLSCSGWASAFAVDDTDVYLLNDAPSDPANPALDGVYRWRAGLLTLVAPIPNGAAMALDADHVYVGASDGLWSMLKDGSALTQLTNERAVAIAADATQVYWLTASAEIHSMAKSGGSVTTLASGELIIYSFVLDDSAIYWSAGTTTGAALRSMPKAGGAPVTIASFANSGGGAVTRAPDGVVFMAIGDDAGGALFSYDPSNGATGSARLLAPPGTGATDIPMLVADADEALVSYWTADGVHPSATSHTDRLDRESGIMANFDDRSYTSGALADDTFYGMAGALFRACK